MSCDPAAGSNTTAYCASPFWTVTSTSQEPSHDVGVHELPRRAVHARARAAQHDGRRHRGMRDVPRPRHGRGRRAVPRHAVKAWLAMVIALASCSDPRLLSGSCDGGIAARACTRPGSWIRRARTFTSRCCSRPTGVSRSARPVTAAISTAASSGVSCLQCHSAGPTACVTCHGAGPTSNAHAAPHAGASVACAECHIVPTSWDQDGHILHDGVAITAPAQVTFGARAGFTLDPADRAGPPTWDGQTCSNVYCHGAVLHDGGGTATAPRWDDPTPPGGCTRCHGDPPPTPSHARTDCATCHPPSAPHIDGIVQVGRTPGCSGCHGSASSPAPPVDLSGNTFTTAVGVGAHQAHLQAPSRISAQIPCATCHVVPTSIDSPGHIDSPTPVVNAALGWNRDRADVLELVLPRSDRSRCGRRPARSAAAAVTAFHRPTRVTRRR